MVEVWMGELAKLKERVVTSNKRKEKEGSEEVGKETQKERRDFATISESTVCLLMDRFVPC